MKGFVSIVIAGILSVNSILSSLVRDLLKSAESLLIHTFGEKNPRVFKCIKLLTTSDEVSLTDLAIYIKEVMNVAKDLFEHV